MAAAPPTAAAPRSRRRPFCFEFMRNPPVMFFGVDDERNVHAEP
jgi:hypothetical protein